MYRNDWIDQQSMRINTLRSVYPGLTDQQIAKQHAVRMSSHVAVRYKHTNASDFTHFGFFGNQSEVDACLKKPDCKDVEVLFDDGMAVLTGHLLSLQDNPDSEAEKERARKSAGAGANCPVTPTLLKLRSYPPEFYLELVKWARITQRITSTQRKSIKRFSRLSQWYSAASVADWGRRLDPAYQKYILNTIQKAVDNGFPGIDGVDISDLLAKKKAPSEKKQEFKRHAVPNKAATMQALFEKQRSKCMYCGKEKHEANDLHLDHKIPVSLGGSNDLSNLQLLCGSCNSRKGNMKDDEFREKYKLPPSSQVTGSPRKVLLQSYFTKITKAA